MVERFFAWISRNWRLWKDTEATIEIRDCLPLRCGRHDPRQTHRAILVISFGTEFQEVAAGLLTAKGLIVDADHNDIQS